jgi:outer membrane protein assembly factor BamB
VGSVPNLQESFTFAAGSQVTGVSVVNGLAYVATFGGTVYAVNATTGVEKWSFATGEEVNVTPAVSGNTVFFGTYGGPGKVYALNASTGAPIWTDDLSSQESNGFTGSPIVVGGLVYIGGESGNEYALNAANGFAQWAFPTGCCFTTAAAYGDGLVYVGPASGGTLYALNASTGAEVWSFSTFQPTAAVTANGAVYVGAADGNVYALNATTGAQIWAYNTGGIAVTALAMSSGVVYAGYYVGHVVAIGAASGSQIWQVSTCGSPSKPVVADGVMYDDCLSYGTTGNDVYALSAAYGYEQWAATIGGNGDCAPALVTNGTVYVGCDDNLLHAYALPVLPDAVQRPNPAQLHPDWRLRAA